MRRSSYDPELDALERELDLAADRLDGLDHERKRDTKGNRLPSPILTRYLTAYYRWQEAKARRLLDESAA